MGQLYGELVVERQVDDLSVIDADSEEGVFVVVVGDGEEVGLFAGQLG